MSKFFLVFIILLQACSYSTYYAPSGKPVFSPGDPAQIAISTQNAIKGNYKPIARVAAISWGDGESAREALQAEAAKVGANLIIDFRIEKASGRTSASGLAVFAVQDDN